MPPKKTKKSNGLDTKAVSGGGVKKADGARKRTQNRIAQQCLRERRAASSRHMDTVFETMRFVAETDQSQRYAMLLDAHMKLAAENQALEEALFRLRKKLLSLSNSAAMAADDAVYDMILGREGGDSRKSHPEASPTVEPVDLTTDAPRTVSNESEAGVALSSPASDSRMAEHVHTDNISLHGEEVAPKQLQQQQQSTILWDDVAFQASTCDLFFADTETLEIPEMDPGTDMRFDLAELMSVVLPTEEVMPPTEQQEQVHVASPWDLCSFAPPQTLTVQSGSAFSSKVLQAATQCISRVQQSGLVRHLVTDQIIEQVAVASVHLISKASGMQQYLYGMNGAAYMERVMYWRLATGARDLVPSPFRPTPLQCGVTVPNLAIDFVNWPEIRDQLLLAGSTVDLDALLRDIVLNTVIDIPHREMAVNVFGQYHSYLHSDSGTRHRSDDTNRNKKDTTNGTPMCAIDPGWVFYQITRNDKDFRPWAPDPVEEALVRELWRWVQGLNSHYSRRGLSLCSLAQSLEEPEDCVVATATTASPISPLGLLSAKYCKERSVACRPFANTKDWKLSKEFAAKYPFFDCSSGAYLMSPDPFISDVY
ncbi:heavy metal translocating p-type ATPase [Grosmannia clavigera kw1407]|uniref:Heavy metal translocating P-type ATPase n=1 Tax=Grosmannia clavigera (strain kw1407 / UAMH 11150) TaxID=655863 RepID=F0XNM1_GROCL|nr:heavy metal translocating p-type ATPase [Grosmannia clavigera kw1407]EFX00677.1 heavy metal translocating p-type ATPase [Grosmannia clavigera kw1407]